jgi:hypothetical protein
MSMQFLLILQVCSFLTGECKTPVQSPSVYADWADCAADASVHSLTLLQKEGKLNVNKYKLAVKYSCHEITSL